MVKSSRKAGNRFIAVGGQWNPLTIAWDPYDEVAEPFPGHLYYARILQELDRLLPDLGITFIVTPNLFELPEYGDHVVVLLREDEWCRTPQYATRVRAVFKTYGTALPWVRPRKTLPTFLETLAALQNLRILIKKTRFEIRSLLNRRFRRGAVYDIPLGYFKQLDLTYKPMAERSLDVSFQGSLRNERASKRSLRYWLRTPKTLSRELLFECLTRIRARHPQFAIEFELTKNFWDVGASEAERFSRTMMETRVCVVPRGTSLETYRYFEALRYGCIVVAETLPHRRYYDGAPVLRVSNWSELESAIIPILSNPREHDLLSRRGVAWWQERASEAAVAAFVASRITPRSSD